MISIEFHPSSPTLLQTFAQVLRDDPSYGPHLQQAMQDQSSQIAAAHFNGQPVGIAVLRDGQLDWMVVHPATRGRGVARDFLGLIEKQLGQTLTLPAECRHSQQAPSNT